MSLKRRTILGGLGATAAVFGAGATPAAGALRVRREINDLEKWYPDDLDRLRRAVTAMNVSKAGVTAWEQNATFHAGRCGEPGKEIHYTWFFYPWHRAFLWVTELNLQHALGDDKVTVPYWHWPVQASVPASFRSGPLDHPRTRLTLLPHEYALQTGLDTTEQYVGTYETVAGRIAIKKIGFGGYGAAPIASSVLEGTPHGAVHNGVGAGRDMGNLKWSPRDPIFYGHHGNLDRLWEVWRGPAGSARRQSEPWSQSGFANQVFDYFDLKTGLTKSVKMGDVMETASLGYRYALPGEGPSGGPPLGVAGQAGGQDVAPDPSLLGAPVNRGVATIASPPLSVDSSGQPQKTQAVLTLQNVQIPADRGVTVAIYLIDRKDKSFSPARGVFAGVVGLVRQPTSVKVNLALDVTDAIRKTKIDAGLVGVVVVPVDDAKAPPLAVEAYRITISPQ